MKPNKCLLTYAVAVTAFMVFANPVARATEEGLPSPGVTPDRVCEAKMGALATVKIEAGPGLKSELDTEFPRTGPCPEGVGTGSCSEWVYRWTVLQPEGTLITNALVSVDSDVPIFASDPPGATVVGDIPGIIPVATNGERFLMFPVSNLTTFTGSFLTPANITPGTLTAASIGKKGSLPRFARCPFGIAGADNRAVQSSNEAIAADRSYEIPGCKVSFNVDQDNKVIPGTIDVVANSKTDECTKVETFQFEVNGRKVEFDTGVQITQAGSCIYSWTNAAGGLSTANCTSCCVKKSTNQCVPKNTLTNPQTQCKAGTL